MFRFLHAGGRQRALRGMATLGGMTVLPVLTVMTPVSATTVAAAASGVFVVDSTGDLPDAAADGICATAAGDCSFRAAITEADAYAGHAVIDFAIPGTGPFTIQTTGHLPLLTNPAGITIDGYSQAGATVNSAEYGSNAVLQVQVEGAGAAQWDGLEATTRDNVVTGLSLFNFRHALWLQGSSANMNSIVGDFICTDVTGTWHATAVNNGAGGVLIQNGASSNAIGTTALADRNVISGCAHRGVIISFVQTRYNTVQNNVIGLNPSGSAALPNWSHGVDVNWAAQDNLVGGPDPGDGNVISGNNQEGVEISHGSYNRRNDVIGNFIGTDITGTKLLPYTGNQMMGIRLEGEKTCDPCAPGAGYSEVAHNVVVGNGAANNWGGILIDKGQQHDWIHDNLVGVLPDGTAAPNIGYGIRIEHGAIYDTIGPGNVIAYNQGAGVEIDSTESQPPSSYVLSTHDNTITQNSIHDNTKLGIDLAPYNQVNVPGARTVIDTTVEDGILAPKISRATATTMTGTACAGCVVEAYVADTKTVSKNYTLTNYGQGAQYLGSATADVNGNFSFTFPASRAAGDVLTADATDANGNSSEFAKDVVDVG